VKAYLEPNIVNWARRADWSGGDLRNRLVALGLMAHFGIHGIYELSRGFLSEDGKADAQRNFRILSELDPVFGPTPDMLFAKELDQLRTGAAVIPVLDELNRASAKYQVNEMAAGRIEAEGVEFIKRREANIDQDHPQYVDHQLQAVRAAVAAGARRPKNFDQVLATFDDQVPGIIRQRLGTRVTRSEAAEIHVKLAAFPALQSAVRADLYLWAIPLMHDAGGSRDKTDDYRHVVEASYAKVFITGDGQLARTTQRIQPNLRVLTWEELEAG
jgi:hypothetical protein